MKLGPFTIPAGRQRPVVQWVPPPEPEPDPAPELPPIPGLFELIAAVTEWRDARQAAMDVSGQSTTHEERAARWAIWNRYSRAETHLMAIARKCRETPARAA
jgi:hypothetical protein